MAAGEKPGAVQRFVRSVGRTKIAQSSSPGASTTPVDAKEIAANVIQNVKPKVTAALGRFKGIAIPKVKKQPEIIFPPPSW
jgi:hypothetical protein